MPQVVPNSLRGARCATVPAHGPARPRDPACPAQPGRPTRMRWILPLGVLLGRLIGSAAAQDPPSTAPATASGAARGDKLITLDAILGPTGRVDFGGTWKGGQRWLPDGDAYLEPRDGRLARVDAVSDAAAPAYDAAPLKAALRGAGLDEKAAESLASQFALTSDDRDTVILRHGKVLYLYRFSTGRLSRVNAREGDFEWLSLSPKATRLAFVRDHDLYTFNLAREKAEPRRLTRGGGENLLNGELDWVYAEEVYTHASRGYWWSPDDRHIAFLQLDETRVPRFTVLNHFPQPDEERYRLKVENGPYPKAGDPNPVARLGVVRVRDGRVRWIDLSAYASHEPLIVRVTWAPDGRLFYQVQDREQRWLDLNLADPESGRTTQLLRETSPAWVNVLDEPRFLSDGSFLWRSERDGWAHLYHYDFVPGQTRGGFLGLGAQHTPARATLAQRITRGEWEVRDIEGVDEKDGWVYFSGTRDSSIESHAYRARLDGTGLERLTAPGASHRVSFSPTCRFFIDTASAFDTPPRVELRRADGSLVRVISPNENPPIREYRLGRHEFLRVPARDGYRMNALLLLPPDFDPAAKYPVWIYTYAGPHAPVVSNSWGGGNMLNHLLAQKGYVVWMCDNRSAGGQGAVSTWQAYQRLGETELADIEDGLRWLIANRPGIDPERVGIYGHSYGGFMTSYALTHSTLFKIGVAGAPVTDWRCYDTIYTERYMRTPQNNPDGYRRTAPTRAAANLHGKLFLMHGIMDDNVHMQNTVQFIDALQHAGKQFEVMFYPRSRHGLFPTRHVTEARLNFIFENL